MPEDGGAARTTWRTVAAVVLIALGCVTVAPATVAVWLRTVVTDTDRYVETVGPLAADPAVQQAVADRITAAIEPAGGSDRIPDRLSALVEEQVSAVVRSDSFAQVWAEANRAAHPRVVAALVGEGTGGAVAVGEDTVSLQLGAFVEAVRQRSVDAGVPLADRLPEVDVELVVLQSDHIPTAREWLGRIDRLGSWLPVLAVGLLVAGVAVAAHRRRALTGAATGVVAVLLALELLLAVARPRYLEALPPTVDRPAASAVVDQVIDPLQTMLRVLLVVALGVVMAVAVRRAVQRRAGRGQRPTAKRSRTTGAVSGVRRS